MNAQIVIQTIENMAAIYKDIGGIVQVVEEGMSIRGFRSLGDPAITWDISTAWYSPSNWVYRWFARAYHSETDPKKLIGFCIHLGGYSGQAQEKMEENSLDPPFMTISLLDSDHGMRTLTRNVVYNLLWAAGWWTANRERVQAAKLVYGTESVENHRIREITYFLDPLSLTDGCMVEKCVVEPMIKMYGGQEDWPLKAAVPALAVTSIHKGGQTLGRPLALVGKESARA